MIIGTKTNGANPTLIAKTVLSSASSSVIFDRVFTTRFNHYKLICVDMTSDDANTSIRVIRRNVGSDVSTTLDYMGHRGNMESGETTNVMTNQTGWWHERNHTLIGSTAFDGCKIYGADGNIAGGKFYIFGMV
jgi:hypothetical protein